MIKVFCDRCGKEITKCNRHGYIALNSRDTKEADLTEENEFERNQYCSSCMNQIREFIKTAPYKAEISNLEECDQSAEKVSETDTECNKNEEKCTQNEEKCTKGTKKHIDIGKIIALKKAGWKIKDIAAEMHMEPQGVSNALYQHKKKLEETGTVMKHIQKQERPKL